LIESLSFETETRIRLLSAAGRVVFDSEYADPSGLDLSARPEIGVALGGDYKARSALTPDRQYMFYYCALPVLEDDRVIGVAYVSRHTGPIIRAIKTMFAQQRLVMWTALGLAALVSATLAYTITYRLRPPQPTGAETSPRGPTYAGATRWANWPGCSTTWRRRSTGATSTTATSSPPPCTN
jgi:hypothetical protein